MTNENEFSMRTEEMTAEEVVAEAKVATIELFKRLTFDKVSQEYDGIVSQFTQHNTPTAVAFAAMLSLIVSRITDPEHNPTIKDVLVHAASVHLIFAHMMSQHPRMKEVRQTMIAVDPLGPVTENGIDGLPKMDAHRADGSVDGGETIVDDDFSIRMPDAIDPAIVKKVVARHMAALKQELAAMSEAVKASKH